MGHLRMMRSIRWLWWRIRVMRRIRRRMIGGLRGRLWWRWWWWRWWGWGPVMIRRGRMRVVELELAGIPGLIFRRRRWWRSRVALLEFHPLQKQCVYVCVIFQGFTERDLRQLLGMQIKTECLQFRPGATIFLKN